MLNWLNIQNFAIVSSIELECPEKMSAFTGETGAGKSIMIDALAILLGGRADNQVIRPQTDKCEIAASFYFDKQSNIEAWLQENDFYNQEQELLVRRILQKEGRSKYYLNGKVATAQQVKTLGEMLLHIHGQHEQQNLLSPHTHREHLDHFSDAKTLRLNVKNCYHDYMDAKDKLNRYEKTHQSPEQIQLWQYQLQEIEELDPKTNELDELYAEHHLLNHAKQYLELTNQAQNILTESDNFNISHSLHHVQQLLQQLPKEQKKIQSAIDMLDSAIIQIEEAGLEMKHFTEELQIDPQRLDWVEERMSQWHLLARKLQVEAKGLPDAKNQLKEKLAQISNLDLEKEHALKALEMARINYLNAAQALSNHRKAHTKPLADSIEKIIHELGMPHAKLSIDVQEQDDVQPHGMDKVEYFISTNPGSLPGPLHKIASGGELSRISLSIHLITAQRGATPTLLFDEVDVGIGGATARKVGQRLRELGEKLQIFCVTHQPQVASLAHQHYLVDKYSENNETFSKVTLLDKNGRIQEIARMLGGLAITEQTRNNAKELLNID